jgi:Holliday junction DNA helicase RuvA
LGRRGRLPLHEHNLMIAHLRGKLLSKHPNQAIVEAGGVGYDVTVSVPTFSALPETGNEVALFIHTHVREDVIALYGFLQTADKTLFEKLIGVSGIGPKLANTILSGMAETSQIVASIRGGDIARLTRIPGVGKKTAERMVLELRDKFPATGVEIPRAAITPVREDVISALLNLGYKQSEVEKALAGIANSAKPESFDLLFREAMALLSK